MNTRHNRIGRVAIAKAWDKSSAKAGEKPSYVLFAQANLHKMPQATVEIVNYINSAMKWYRYDEVNGRINNTRKPTAAERERDRRSQQKQGAFGTLINVDGTIEIPWYKEGGTKKLRKRGLRDQKRL